MHEVDRAVGSAARAARVVRGYDASGAAHRFGLSAAPAREAHDDLALEIEDGVSVQLLARGLQHRGQRAGAPELADVIEVVGLASQWIARRRVLDDVRIVRQAVEDEALAGELV